MSRPSIGRSSLRRTDAAWARAWARVAPLATWVALTACGAATREADVDVDADTDEVSVEDTREETREDAPADSVDTVEIGEPPGCRIGLVAGPLGTRRGDLGDDFELALADGGTLALSAVFDGCESFVFVSDGIPISALDATSIWESESDLVDLLDRSPDDVHYVFVSTAYEDAAPASISGMQSRIDGVLAGLSEGPRSHWRAHLHVVATRAQDLDSWVGSALVGHLAPGFCIDHAQRIRGLGTLADVSRYDEALAGAGQWAWRNNLAYVAYEADYMRAEAERAAALEAERATVVPVFAGEVLSQLEEVDVPLPSPDELAGFDTLEVEITQRCPDEDKPELAGNCGAWDYLASLHLGDPDDEGGSMREVARFITSYHRETHWVADITPMLALIADGGTRRLRWEFAPEWNVQPTATWLSLRFSNKNKGMRPVSETLLFTGGDFGAHYNDRAPIDVSIPLGTRRAEVWTLVTGHGSGPNHCAEFCAHSHVIGVGRASYFKSFIEAGVDDGCIAALRRGMTPNQGGTWWFGRGGWCPGAPVEPWIIDVTGDVTLGASATFTYQGLLGGRTPPDGSGNIVLTSYLVLYE